MKSALNRIVLVILAAGFSACSPFYTRHYTKGVYYEGFLHRTQAATQPQKSMLHASLKTLPDNTPVVSGKDTEEKIVLQEASGQALTRTTAKASSIPAFSRNDLHSSPVLRKALKPVRYKFQASQHRESVLGKAAFYILALVLAVGILALAIYFLPAIMIPSAAASAFATVVTIGAIVVVCVFAFLIYTLFKLLIDIFKHNKATEEPESEDF